MEDLLPMTCETLLRFYVGCAKCMFSVLQTLAPARQDPASASGIHRALTLLCRRYCFSRVDLSMTLELLGQPSQ